MLVQPAMQQNVLFVPVLIFNVIFLLHTLVSFFVVDYKFAKLA